VSEFRVEKRRESAQLTLTTGSTLSGFFLLSGSSQGHMGSERVGDVLNLEDGFFPFGMDTGTSLINRAHVLKVTLPAKWLLGRGWVNRSTVPVVAIEPGHRRKSVVRSWPSCRERKLPGRQSV
jgi:hypothetical protein